MAYDHWKTKANEDLSETHSPDMHYLLTRLREAEKALKFYAEYDPNELQYMGDLLGANARAYFEKWIVEQAGDHALLSMAKEAEPWRCFRNCGGEMTTPDARDVLSQWEREASKPIRFNHGIMASDAIKITEMNEKILRLIELVRAKDVELGDIAMSDCSEYVKAIADRAIKLR